MKKLFVLGSDIGYSLSPRLFGEMFRLFGERAEYSISDIPRDRLSDIRSICEGAVGFNVTKPFKEEIIKYLSADKSGIGSVNTVKAETMVGFSTDGAGLMFDLKTSLGNIEGPVLVVGYGGAAKACVRALSDSGLKVFVTGRNIAKAEAFAAQSGACVYDGSPIEGVVSCTSETFVPNVREVEFCYDIRYNTPDVLKVGKRNLNGIGMLVAQAIYSYGIFFDKRFDKSELRSVYCKLKEII